MTTMRKLRLRQRSEPRRGAIAVLAAFVLVGVMAVAGFLMCLSYAELANTELQAATDAAARSAIIRTVITQSEEEGREAAMQIAALHRVGGKPLTIDPDDVVFGQSEKQGDSTFTFEPDQSPLNAARVAGRKRANAPAGAVDLPFGTFIGQETFETQRASTAMRLDYDIVLVLDRSGSMGWDLSQNRFSYPVEIEDRPTLENYFSPPTTSGSRWAVLSDSVDEFLQILDQRNVSARIALVTFANDYEFGLYTAETVTVDSDFTESSSAINNAISSIGQYPLIGGTDIGAGLEQAQTLLTSSSQARTKTAQPIVVLFSDGIFTDGDDPVVRAQSMNAATGTLIHSVTFGAEVEARQTMDDVAHVAGRGLSLHADDAAELVSSFEKIANSIPVIVIK